MSIQQVLGPIMGLIFLSLSLNAQKDTIEAKGDLIEISSVPDSAFLQARNFAFEGDYLVAEKILNLNIERYPENKDYQIFYARVKSWQKQYDTARVVLAAIVKEDSSQLEAYELLATVERYDGQYDTAIGMSNDGLRRFPNNEVFFINKAQSQVGKIDYRDALETVDTALQVYPNNRELKQLKVFLLNQLIVEGIAIGAGVDYFFTTYEPWFSALLQYGTMTDIGAVIARINYANRFGNINGTQFEVDAYPQFGKGKYMYLNAGYSNSELFPNWRFGAEFYSIIPTTPLEASIGFRHLIFGRDNTVTMYTGSLGWYFGDNFLQFRPFFINQDPRLGTSYNLLYRHFMTGMGDFYQFSAGVGLIPNSRFIELGGLLSEDIFIQSNQYVAFAYQKLINDKMYLRTDLGLTRQEQAAVPDDFFNFISIFFTLGFRI